MTVYVFGWQELALRIRDGSIATDLSRPLDPQRYWLAFDLGRAPYHLLFRGVPPFVVGALVFELHYPSPLDARRVLRRASCSRSSSASASASSTTRRRSGCSTSAASSRFRLTVSLFFSGMILPLTFFPALAARRSRHALPFASIMQTPIDIWLGKHHGLDAGRGHSRCRRFWALVLLGLGRRVARRGTRKLVIQGG